LTETKRKTLISATKEDVHEYRTASKSSFKAFYGFLANAGWRDDNPTKAAARNPRKRRPRK
jgi:site-specific recombinase XerD